MHDFSDYSARLSMRDILSRPLEGSPSVTYFDVKQRKFILVHR